MNVGTEEKSIPLLIIRVGIPTDDYFLLTTLLLVLKLFARDGFNYSTPLDTNAEWEVNNLLRYPQYNHNECLAYDNIRNLDCKYNFPR